MPAALRHAFATEPFEVFLRALRRRLEHLGVRLVDGRVLSDAEAAAQTGQVVELARALLAELAERPADALRMLDVLVRVGVTALEPARAGCEAACAERYPPPPAPGWRELADLRDRAARHPAHCRLGPPARHVQFATRLRLEGTEVPDELLALYAAFSHLALRGLHVATSACTIGDGDALRVHDGRLVVVERVRRHPATKLVEQPAISIAHLLGTFWFVLEDERAPATRRPLDVQGLLRFALRRMDAPTLEALLTDLAWRQFFT